MLKGSRVLLREKRIEDAESDYAWRCDAQLARLDATRPMTIPFEEFLEAYVDELNYPAERRRRFAIDSLEGKHIGNCMFYEIDEVKKQAELGILIGDKSYWDKGYGADAVNTLLSHIFDTTGLERVYLHTLDWNVRAQRCFQKCGFVSCGQIARDGNSFVVMEIRREWLKGR